MKKVFLSLVVLIVSVLAFTSCSKDEDKGLDINYSLIIGSWSEFSESQGEYVSSSTEVIWTFNADNTASQRVIFKMNNVTMRDISNSFSYVYNGKSIVLKGEKNTFEYEVSVSGNKMSLGNSEDGYFDLTKK